MKAHRTDNVSLFFGLLFIAVAGGWTVAEYTDVKLPVAGWFIAGGLVIFGVLAIVGALVPGKSQPAVETAAVEERPAGDGPMLGG